MRFSYRFSCASGFNTSQLIPGLYNLATQEVADFEGNTVYVFRLASRHPSAMHLGVAERDKGSIVVYMHLLTTDKSRLAILSALGNFHNAALLHMKISKRVFPPYSTCDYDIVALDAVCKVYPSIVMRL